MFELIAFLGLFALAAGALLFVGLVFKLLFKIVLFPVWLVLGLVKLVAGLATGLIVAVLCVVLAPLAVVLLLFVGLPLLALFALFGFGCAVVAA